jgi:hypothetical protein
MIDPGIANEMIQRVLEVQKYILEDIKDAIDRLSFDTGFAKEAASCAELALDATIVQTIGGAICIAPPNFSCIVGGVLTTIGGLMATYASAQLLKLQGQESVKQDILTGIKSTLTTVNTSYDRACRGNPSQYYPLVRQIVEKYAKDKVYGPALSGPLLTQEAYRTLRIQLVYKSEFPKYYHLLYPGDKRQDMGHSISAHTAISDRIRKSVSDSMNDLFKIAMKIYEQVVARERTAESRLPDVIGPPTMIVTPTFTPQNFGPDQKRVNALRATIPSRVLELLKVSDEVKAWKKSTHLIYPPAHSHDPNTFVWMI